MIFTTEDKQNIIVVYHYVEDPRKDRAGIHPCSIREFERQVKFLSSHFQIVSVQEVYENVVNRGRRKMCAITFDDGLKDQYENAVPILKKYNARATFYIITSTFDGEVPSTHKLHAILSNISPGALVEKYHFFLRSFFPEYISKYNVPEDEYLEDILKMNRPIFDKPLTMNLKHTLTILPQPVREKFIAWMLKELLLDEQGLCRQFFMDVNDVRDLSQNHLFEVGSHSHTHRAFDQLTKDELRHEISFSKEKLKDLIGYDPSSFCYPFGRLHKNISYMCEYLKKENFFNAVTIDSRVVSKSENPFLIPRLDTVQINCDEE